MVICQKSNIDAMWVQFVKSAHLILVAQQVGVCLNHGQYPQRYLYFKSLTNIAANIT